MRTTFVLIDFENVKPSTLDALHAERFQILLFVGAHQAKIPIELATAMQRMGNRAQYVRSAGNGSNALDFHIAYYLGKLGTQHPTASFHIISKDSGFDPLIQHLKSSKMDCSRCESIDDIASTKIVVQKSPDERAQAYISMLQKPKSTKPRTVKSLSSAIGAFFQKQLSDDEIGAVLTAMQKRGFVTVLEGKLSYATSG